MSKLTHLTISQAREGLNKGEFSSVELTQSFLDEIGANKELNAYIALTPELALERAKKSDEKRKNGKSGLMEGLPVAIKDVFCTKDVSSTSCSKMLEGFNPPYESTVSQNLIDQGAIMLGKTNMDEFAMGSATINTPYGPTINPWKANNDKNTKLVAGGSSGGSAAAMAANLCLGATGSDTGGSIRQPASFCGIVGVKPTYGRCSRWGMIAFASSLDQAGVFAKDVEGAAIMLEAMCGNDPKDSTSSKEKTPHFSKAITGSIKGKKIGIPKEYHQKGVSQDIEDLWEKGKAWLKEAGAEVIDLSLPHTKYALPTYYIIAPAEASSNLARYDGVRYGARAANENGSLDDMYEATREAFGDEVKRRLMIGTYVLSAGYYDAYYKKAQQVRTLIARDFEEAFKKVDAILTPTTPSPAFAIGEKMDPLTMYLNDVFTVPASLAGLPGISIPAGLSKNGLPLGLQLLTPQFDEENLFNIAAELEKAADFKTAPTGEK